MQSFLAKEGAASIGEFRSGGAVSRRDYRVTEGRFRALFDHAALGIAVVRPGGRIAEVNPALMDMFGRSVEEFAAVTFPELIHPEDFVAESEQARRLVNREIDSYCRENRYRHKDGTWFWGRVTVSLVPGEGDGRFAVVMIEDIDDRKRAEEDLSLFRAVMDASHEGVAILSPTGRVLYANCACQRLFGEAGESVVGRDGRDFLPLESRVALQKVIAPTLRLGHSWEGVLKARDVRGRAFPLWQRAGAVRDTSGMVKFFFAFMHDHTGQHIFEEELFNAKEAAEAANVAKTRFLAAASHDLRQPMQALGMFVTVLSGREMDEKHAALVARIRDSVMALEGLLDSLLDVSKLEAGLVVPHKANIPVGAVMARLASEFEPLCAAAGLRLAIVQRLANLLGHRIEVVSREGKGSMFAVEVSLAGETAAPLPSQLPLPLSHRGAAVVVIDDEPDVLDGLGLLLESWGHTVLAATSAEDAIRRLPQLGRKPDLILADYRLQNGDTGGQAIARLRVHLRQKCRVPAIILTGDTAPERLHQAQALGHRLLHKPVEAETLRAAIDEALSRRPRNRRSGCKGPARKAAATPPPVPDTAGGPA